MKRKVADQVHQAALCTESQSDSLSFMPLMASCVTI